MAKFTKYIAICLVAFGTGASAISQQSTQNLYPALLRQILSLQFSAADSLINKADSGKAAEHEILYLRNYMEFLDVMTTGDRSGYENYLSGAALRLDSMQSGHRLAPEPLPMLSASYLQTSFLNVLFGENLKAARNFYVARRYLRQAEAASPGDPFNDKLEGLIHLVAGTAPEEYHWLMRIFGIRGDVQTGMEKLGSYHKNTFGIMLYASLITGLEPKPFTAECEGDTLTLHRYFYAYRAQKSGRSQEVISLLKDWRQQAGESRFAYPDLVLGEALFLTPLTRG